MRGCYRRLLKVIDLIYENDDCEQMLKGFSGRSLRRTPADCRWPCLMPRNLSFGTFWLAIESR